MKRERMPWTTRQLGPAVLGSERSIAVLRAVVVAVAGLAYAASIGVRRHLGPFAISILVLAIFYSAWVVLARPYLRYPTLRYGAATVVLDAGLVTLWVGATGGPHSEFWTLYLIVVMSVAMRYRPSEVIGTACGLSVLYAVVTQARGGPVPDLLLRPALILVAGVAGALLADQVQRSRQERTRFQRIAEESSATLAAEREATRRLREMDREKTDALATASHELRAPLAGILGVLSTLRVHGGHLDDATRDELLGDAQIQASRLAR